MSKSTARQATARFEIRCTEEDAARIRAKASAAEISVSDLMRSATLGRKIKTPTDKKLMAALLQLGGLQKHLFNQMQEGMTAELSKQFSDVLIAIKNAVNAIDLSQTSLK